LFRLQWLFPFDLEVALLEVAELLGGRIAEEIGAQDVNLPGFFLGRQLAFLNLGEQRDFGQISLELEFVVTAPSDVDFDVEAGRDVAAGHTGGDEGFIRYRLDV